jgi:hypothetical protein
LILPFYAVSFPYSDYKDISKNISFHIKNRANVPDCLKKDHLFYLPQTAVKKMFYLKNN